MVPAGKVLMHGLGGGSPHRVCVLPNLIRDIDQRDNDGNGADDLPDIPQVVEIHVSEALAVAGQALRLPNQKAATDAVALQFELTFGLRGLKMNLSILR